MSTSKAAIKSAELLAAAGIFLLGAGVGAWYADTLGRYVVPLLALGGACHAIGMYAKHRLEASHGAELPTWYRLLYWLCWVLLAAVAAYLLLRGTSA
jgi:hypothetical protein